jgi:hypothetical protein
VLALPEVQEQCAQFQVITVVSRGNHYVNYYRRERHCTAVRANTRDPADTQWMTDWLTDLQTIRPLRDTNRLMNQLEMHEATPPSPMLVAYSNPQKVRFAVFSHSPDQLKYQDAKTAWNRIFQTDSHAAPEEGMERGERSANPKKTDKSHRRRTQAGVKEQHQNAQVG